MNYIETVACKAHTISPMIKGIIRWLTYDHSKQHGAVECIQYCQRSSHLALSRCCKTENVQGTLRHTPNRQTAGKDKFQQSSHTKLVIWKQTSGWTAVVKSSNTENRPHSTVLSRRVSVTKHTAGTGIHYLMLYQTILVLNQSSHVLLLLDIFQPYMCLPKNIFRGTCVY